MVLDKDPNDNFTVRDGILRISGRDFGGLVTRDEYSNYEVQLGYSWGSKVWAPREKTARGGKLQIQSEGAEILFKKITLKPLD